jgi:hypothetical protein
MCDKCADLDKKIEHYRQMLLSIGDQITVERIEAMISDLQAQRAHTPSGAKAVGPPAVGGLFNHRASAESGSARARLTTIPRPEEEHFEIEIFDSGTAKPSAASRGEGQRTFQCFDCDRPDPMKTERATGWLMGALQPLKR